MKPVKGLVRQQIFSSNLKHQLEEKGCTRTELSQALQVPYSTVSEWMRGRMPRLDTIQKLADFFECTVSDLLEDRGNISPLKVNVLGSLDPNDVIDFLYERYDVLLDSPVFGLRIHGDGMAPDLCNGDTVVVRCQKDSHTPLKSGDIIIATINGDITCKEFQEDEDGITLIPRNKKYKSTHYTQEDIDNKVVDIYGKVIEVRRIIGE